MRDVEWIVVALLAIACLIGSMAAVSIVLDGGQLAWLALVPMLWGGLGAVIVQMRRLW